MLNSNSGHSIIPGNNTSGASTQGSSTKDFKSSAKKRKLQQEWYYKSSVTPCTQFTPWKNDQIPPNKQNYRSNSNLQFEGIYSEYPNSNPALVVVEESKRGAEEHWNNIRKSSEKRDGLYEYKHIHEKPEKPHKGGMTDQMRNNPVSKSSLLKGDRSMPQCVLVDQNTEMWESQNAFLDSSELSRIEHNLSHVYEVPQPETRKDLENLLSILNDLR